MPNYIYTAKSFEDKTVNGVLPAKDMRELARILKNEGLFLVQAESDEKKEKKPFEISIPRKVSSAEKIVLIKNLAIMVSTGLSLVKSFEVLAAQAKNKKLKTALSAAKEEINKGESISSALSKYPDIFSDFFLSMIKIGEESGTLEEILKNLALQLEKEHRLKSGVQQAMIYPVIVLSLMLMVGGVVVVFVLPRLKKFFSNMDAEIPFYTKMLVNSGDFASANWPILLIAPIVLGFLIYAALKTSTGKWMKDVFLLKLPVFSAVIKENNCAILIRSLSSLLSSGVPLIRSLEVSAGIVGNFYFKKAINDALEKVKEGESLSGALGSARDIFPYGALEMIEVGEETGKTSVVLKSLAEFYEDEVLSATAKLSALIEPVLLVVLGLGVGFFAFSIIEPMYSSLSAIQ